MPIYEFECQNCHDVLQLMMKFEDPHPSKCESCGAKSLTKIVSPSRFHLKGGGWYSEGYDSKSNKAGDSQSDSKTTQAPSTGQTKSNPQPKEASKAATSSKDTAPTSTASAD